ncbi:MAG: thiamine diphosphokinase [Acidimicrobiia bacterium]|nr:thiamine diphosphokinase [Acidimicrobiia bacterium]
MCRNRRCRSADSLPAGRCAAVSGHAWVVAGGEPPGRRLLGELAPPKLIVAADSGADVALGLGLRVDVVVGDFDSATPAAAAAAGERRRFPTDKDATDLALALAEARDRGAASITLVGGAGGRLDHLLANVAAITAEELAEVRIDAAMGSARLWVVRRAETLRGAVGDLVTLLAHGGPATGVGTSGLRWALAGETLEAGSSRGVSNVFEAREATVTLESGVILAIRP